jgi:HEAT repeat protein
LVHHNASSTRPVLVKALRDKNPEVRATASSRLSQTGNKSDAAMLQGAIAAEDDPEVRSQMQTDLEALLQK